MRKVLRFITYLIYYSLTSSESPKNERQLSAISTITTVAGTGNRGYSGDGGLATSAKLSSPYGVAVDASGNIYISDSDNNAIRMVTKSTSKITAEIGRAHV